MDGLFCLIFISKIITVVQRHAAGLFLFYAFMGKGNGLVGFNGDGKFVIVVFSSSTGHGCLLALALLWRLPIIRHGDDFERSHRLDIPFIYFCLSFSFVNHWLPRIVSIHGKDIFSSSHSRRFEIMCICMIWQVSGCVINLRAL